MNFFEERILSKLWHGFLDFDLKTNGPAKITLAMIQMTAALRK
jgi:hypothetical protein